MQCLVEQLPTSSEPDPRLPKRSVRTDRFRRVSLLFALLNWTALVDLILDVCNCGLDRCLRRFHSSALLFLLGRLTQTQRRVAVQAVWDVATALEHCTSSLFVSLVV